VFASALLGNARHKNGSQNSNHMPDEKIDRFAPLGFYHLAEDFYRAAVRSASLEDAKPRLHYSLVLYHLHTHSIELTLKAFLRAKGIDVKELKNKFSHGMMGLMGVGTERKLKVRKPKRSLHILERLDQLGKVQTFRYFEAGFLSLPTLDEVRQLNERMLSSVRPACIATLKAPSSGL
jgi:hypothetical protein